MTGVDLQIAPEFSELLRANDLNTFEKITACRTGTVMRSVPGRSTVRLELPGGVLYLKRYNPDYYLWWQRLIGIHDEARHEWDMIHALRQAGFFTATPVATGRLNSHSFLITAAIPGGVSADKVFAGLHGQARTEFIKRVADLTRRFHGAGFIHKDYYLSHIFVAGNDLYLIDLQRAVGPGSFGDRWRVKDLGQLVYTLQLAGATDAELSEWLADQRVRDRAAALHARGPKHDVIWNQPGVDPR